VLLEAQVLTVALALSTGLTYFQTTEESSIFLPMSGTLPEDMQDRGF